MIQILCNALYSLCNVTNAFANGLVCFTKQDYYRLLLYMPVNYYLTHCAPNCTVTITFLFINISSEIIYRFIMTISSGMIAVYF